MKLFYIFLLVIIASSSARAEDYTMNTLLSECKTSEKISDTGKADEADLILAGSCLGMIRGTVTTINLLVDINSLGKGYCRTPTNWTIGQGIKIFIKWAEDNPDKLHLRPVIGIIASHNAAFCKKEK